MPAPSSVNAGAPTGSQPPQYAFRGVETPFIFWRFTDSWLNRLLQKWLPRTILFYFLLFSVTFRLSEWIKFLVGGELPVRFYGREVILDWESGSLPTTEAAAIWGHIQAAPSTMSTGFWIIHVFFFENHLFIVIMPNSLRNANMVLGKLRSMKA